MSRNINSSTTNGKNKHNTTSGEWECGDLHVPARGVQLIFAKKLTLTHVQLISMIGPLVKHRPDGTGRGSFSFNSYYANAMNKNANHISDCISYLEKIGVILIVNMNGTRYLELEWSRTAEERESLKGKYGELLRKAHDDMTRRLRGQEVVNNCEDTENSGGGDTENSGGHPIEEEDLSPSSGTRESTHNGFHLNGNSKSSFSHQCADQLYKAILAKRKLCRVVRELSSWAAEFTRLLREADKDEVISVLDWYCLHMGEEYIPEAFSATSFRKKYVAIISARERYKRERNKFTPKDSHAENGYVPDPRDVY